MNSSWRPHLVVASLVVSNLVPLVGVVGFGWNLGTILAVYWLEGIVVAVESAARALRAEGRDDPEELPEMGMGGTSLESLASDSNRDVVVHLGIHFAFLWLLIGFFVGFFMLIVPPSIPDVALGLVGLVAMVLVKTAFDFWGEWKRQDFEWTPVPSGAAD